MWFGRMIFGRDWNRSFGQKLKKLGFMQCMRGLDSPPCGASLAGGLSTWRESNHLRYLSFLRSVKANQSSHPTICHPCSEQFPIESHGYVEFPCTPRSRLRLRSAASPTRKQTCSFLDPSISVRGAHRMTGSMTQEARV